VKLGPPAAIFNANNRDPIVWINEFRAELPRLKLLEKRERIDEVMQNRVKLSTTMETLDCAIFYEWEYDDDFIRIVSDRMKLQNVSVRVYCAGEFGSLLERLEKEEISIGAVIDRASDADETCSAVVRKLIGRGSYIVNDPEATLHASDKASMHLEFITAGIFVPYTIIISPYNAQKEVRLSIGELARLGRPFIIKPANTTGGGIGVVTGAEGLQEVIETRQHHKNDKYLLQSSIEPATLNGRRAWFRPFYVFGKILTCWWDDQTHIYFEAAEDEISAYNLVEIEKIVLKIYRVCKLEFFSTEIALTSDGKFIVIDYVNEMCDMRIKSRHYDGVPDNVVEAIGERVAIGVRRVLEQGR
jgi:hypothetical protein